MDKTIIAAALNNVQDMAENLMKCPANEQNIAHTQEFTAQALRDLVTAIREMMTVGLTRY